MEADVVKRLTENIKKELKLQTTNSAFDEHIQNAITEIKLASNVANVSELEIVSAITKELRASQASHLSTQREDMARLPYAYFTRLLIIKHGYEYIKNKLPEFYQKEPAGEKPEKNHLKVRHVLAIKHNKESVPYYALANENKVLDYLVHLGYIKRIPNSKDQLADDLYLTEKGEEIIEELRKDPAYLRRLFQRARNRYLRDFLSEIWDKHIEVVKT